MDNELNQFLEKRNESENLDFKEEFNVKEVRDWCEIIKDIIAISNSGGGYIFLPVTDEGITLDTDITEIVDIDNAVIVDKISKYTDIQFSGIEIFEAVRDNKKIVVLKISSTKIPIVFTREGGYDDKKAKAKKAFAKGTLYFRHGAKSETANSHDLFHFFERRLSSIREEWFKNVRKVVEAPEGYEVKVLPPEVILSDSPDAIPIRIDESSTAKFHMINPSEVKLVNDEKAPRVNGLDPNKTHPFKSTDITNIFKRECPEATFNIYDVWATLEVYNLKQNPNMYYKSKFASTAQFSNAYIEFLIDEFKKDKLFFLKTRNAYVKIRRKRKKKYYCTYIDINLKQSILNRYKISEDKTQFRIVLRANSKEEAEGWVYDVFNIEKVFAKEYLNLQPNKEEMKKCNNNDFIIELDDEIYISVDDYINS